jgi:predicted amidohydrolase
MRKIKAAAIQPGLMYVPHEYYPASDTYKNDPDAIIENYVKKQLETTFRLLEKAGSEHCGIVTTCEDAAVLADFAMDISEKSVFTKLVETAQQLAEAQFSAISKKYSMYVIGCSLTKQNGKIYNSATIFDRKGNIAGRYNKTHLPPNEKWQCEGGDSFDVFDLDFGKIGICICYDMMFPEPVQILALKGAEIIFHPTFGYGWYDSIGEAALRTRANDNGVYIVTSKNYVYNAAGKSSVIDYWGQVLADAGFAKDVILTGEIDLDIKKKQPDWFFNTRMSGIAEVTERMRMERRPELYLAEYKAINEKSKKLKIPDREEKLKILEEIRKGECRW